MFVELVSDPKSRVSRLDIFFLILLYVYLFIELYHHHHHLVFLEQKLNIIPSLTHVSLYSEETLGLIISVDFYFKISCWAHIDP